MRSSYLSLFLFFSVCCGLSRSLPTMILFRALQGLTGGALIPLAFQVILSLPASKRTLGMALFSITATFAPAIGPTVGGYLTETFHWPVIFFLNVIPGAFMLFTIFYAIPPDKADPSLRGKVDYAGIATMALGLASLTIFLEEGQRKDWFGSSLIIWLGISAFVFLSSFLYIELTTKEPFINLRLLKQRNFGLGCLVNVVIGLAMYGALYLLPMYLSTIARYNSIYIGKTMMWAGLPQLVILPFVPKLLARFDARFVAFVGINVFAASCIMNSALTDLVGLDQLQWSQMVRAVGQPLLMVPLSTITMGLVAREQSGSASGLFNMLRNLGGSVGIAMLSTLLTVREQFHSAKLGEGISIYSRATRDRLNMLQAGFVSHGFDPATAMKKAIAALDATVRRQAYVMAFNDCFLAVGVALVGASCLILLCKKVGASSGPSEAH
ncbi:MAG: DHA2 family efflux MFS transporter permease subunit [Proteobacteria bacterium]|nr:MAG: DHA2 family efflux MFS transporter permease subunit [Pseudomonadota bacterium]